MSNIPLRNNQGQLIGWLETVLNNRQQIRNAQGKLLGWYDVYSNKTICANTGRWVGTGNLLTSLLA